MKANRPMGKNAAVIYIWVDENGDTYTDRIGNEKLITDYKDGVVYDFLIELLQQRITKSK